MKLTKNIIQTAKSVLQNEADAIKNLLQFVNDDFAQCIEELLNNKGRLIITGIGKSAIIGQKMVATFNSTGTPSIFMHAADAIHGDLGIVQDDDIVLCISKSGNTEEIKVLVPLLKRNQNKIIALVGNSDSYLAKQSDYVILTTIDQEACPLNLAPTTSTTACLAMGDAIAVCLLELRGFTEKDFAKYHPGGSLGKRLYMKVSDIYPQNPFPSVHLATNVKEIIFEISSKRLGATAVIDENKHLLGIITDGDIRRMIHQHEQIFNLTAGEIMSKSPKTIQEDAYAMEALQLMQEKNITQLIVMKEKAVVGFVHLHDLLKEGIV